MYSIYTALTGDSSNEGIKSINVFYDTLFLNFKSYDSLSGTYTDHVLIEKIKFDYDTSLIESASQGHIISFGNSETPIPFHSTGNTFIDNILFETQKSVLICGLSSMAYGLTALANENNVISGNSYIPIIYKYDINSDSLINIYPKMSDLSAWNSFVLGEYLSGQTPLVSFNNDTNTLNFIFKTTVDVISPTVINLDSVNDIVFKFNANELNLTNVRQLTASRTGTDFIDYDYVKFKNHSDNRKLIVSNRNDEVQVFTLL